MHFQARLHFGLLGILCGALMLSGSLHAEAAPRKVDTPPDCRSVPSFLEEARVEVLNGLKSLPEGVLVARKAELYVTGSAHDGSDLRLHMEEDFMRSSERQNRSRLHCAFTNSALNTSFGFVAPVLFDLKKVRKQGHRIWSFQAGVNEGQYAIWNRPSISFDLEKSAAEVVKSLGMDYRIYSRSNNVYELFLIQDRGQLREYLSIIYDFIPAP